MKPAAKQGDLVTGNDVHVVLVPVGGGVVPTPTPMPFAGKLTDELSQDVLVEELPAALMGSIARNSVDHVAPTGTFQRPPSNRGTVDVGSGTVFINGKPAARAGDAVKTCNDPNDAPTSAIVSVSTVLFGD